MLVQVITQPVADLDIFYGESMGSF